MSFYLTHLTCFSYLDLSIFDFGSVYSLYKGRKYKKFQPAALFIDSFDLS